MAFWHYDSDVVMQHYDFVIWIVDGVMIGIMIRMLLRNLNQMSCFVVIMFSFMAFRIVDGCLSMGDMFVGYYGK